MENIFESFKAKESKNNKVPFHKSSKAIEDQRKIARFKREFRFVSRIFFPDFDAEVGMKKSKKEGRR